MNNSINVDVLKSVLRQKRERVCFPVINRGQLWYNQLSSEQYVELVNWYHAWLDVTNTLVAPKAPAWLNKKLTQKEEIL
jgi:hypothetical protein